MMTAQNGVFDLLKNGTAVSPQGRIEYSQTAGMAVMSPIGSLTMRNLTVLLQLNSGDTLQIRNSTGATRFLNDQSQSASSISAYITVIKLN
jgi:hypothetical protein